ncbi:Uncharacterised protein [Candidatus Venteria ishoeyi]|uniref:Bacterial membrane flanked domain protein n=1 Tax=Candidatus Venteria ishoeyi TaxID=1899563 RepID=A0A1H6F8W8_9GAMM|nr:Uncharacterised protein [Candidatus Venteria ishoeyi]
MFLTDYTIYGIACVGVFSLWFLYFHVADYQFIEFSDENGKIILRYFKAVKFGKGQFSSIEFPQHLLQEAYFQNSMFGKLSDLTLLVKTKRGVAEYPTVSLSALNLNDRRRIQIVLNDILDN